MRLVGYSRKKLDRESDLTALWDAVTPVFDKDDFRFAVAAGDKPESARLFDFQKAVKELQTKNIVGFYKENVVGIGLDNQQHSNPFFIYPHTTVDVETTGEEMQMSEWVRLSEKLVDSMGLELAVVHGRAENVAGYLATPLGVGIGLNQVY